MEINYSFLDRQVHKLAFSVRPIQTVLCDLEKSAYRKDLSQISVSKPIFVTSLPRAGTTLLLNVLATCPELASHNYRNMPFVRSPIIWSSMSRIFQKQMEKKERAHADGVLIDYDSPEAFEDIIWHDIFPDLDSGSSIRLERAEDATQNTRTKIDEHLRKIIYLKQRQQSEDIGTVRYVSKNNGNIGRLGLLKRVFPDAHVVIPFRHPLQHATSMLNQHKRFLDVHKEERFVQTYMRDIKHFEFGSLHKPIAFPLLSEHTKKYSSETINYWLAYWLKCFSYAEQLPGNIWFSYEEFLTNPEVSMRALCDAIDVEYQSVAPGIPSVLDKRFNEKYIKDVDKGLYQACLDKFDSLGLLSVQECYRS